jgi:diacylglycerol kinase family enzyme
MAAVPDRPTNERPPFLRRIAAIASILLASVVVVATIVLVIDRPARLLAVLGLISVMLLAAWFALTRTGGRRIAAAAAGAAAVAGVAALLVSAPGFSVLWRVLLLVLAAGLARYALVRDVRTLKQSLGTDRPVPAAAAGVLIMNPRSGGGKVEKFRLVDECRRRGIEPVVLQPGDDLLELAQEVVQRGADVIGMAGGDGSQALVASVAAARGIPHVVVPAGTRNHLALDLGLDRDDVVGALDAFGEALERVVDLAEVNGRTFVNNVSLGLYAEIVRTPEYREAKVDTTLSALPRLLGPGTKPSDLHFQLPDGRRQDGAHVVQVSNGAYGTTVTTLGSRLRLDSGRLGIAALLVADDRAAARFLSALATDRLDRYPGFVTWESDGFTIDAATTVPTGIDGETIMLEPPLRFQIRPGAVRIRVPRGAIRTSPAARSTSLHRSLPDLWRVARGVSVSTRR